MGLFGVLVLSFGAFGIATASECVPETSKCSIYWEKILPHKYLIATEDELNLWCSKQDSFYECLEDVLLEGKNENLPTNLLVSKLYSQDVCTDNSTNRRRLLSNADCINQLNTEFCSSPEYLDIVAPDDSIPSTRCSEAEKIFSCIAATMVLNCGFDAGHLYRAMLKITRYSDEVCGIEASGGIPLCRENSSKSDQRDRNLSEVYYGLYHRIGEVLDQHENEIGDSESEEDISVDIDKVVTEAIKSAIDDLDESLSSEECDSPDCLNSAHESISIDCLKDHKEYKHYMKSPVITKLFKEILFYNYSGHEYAVYWRQPEFTVIDNFECEHLQPSYSKGVIFRCKIEYRHSDPACLSNDLVHEKVTPEFIRSFDPDVPCESPVEFGPGPIWMKEIDEAYGEKRICDETATEAPDGFTTSANLLHLTSSMFSSEKPEKWYEFDLRANNMNSIFPNDIHYELLHLFKPDPVKYAPPPMNRVKVGDTMFFLIYDPELTKSIENLTCSRLDECHPRGKGLWKCKMWPRKIETCHSCDIMETEANTINVPDTSHFDKLSESQFTLLEATEPTVIADGSGVLADAAFTDESIALVFSKNAENEKIANIYELVEDEVMTVLDSDDKSDFTEEYEHEDTELQSDESQEYSLQADTNEDEDKVHFQVLASILDTDENSELSETAYEMLKSEDNESEIIITDESGNILSGNIVLLKDFADLIEAE